MAAELELEPSPETQELIEGVRSRELTNGVAHEAVDVATAAPRAGQPVGNAAVTNPKLSTRPRREFRRRTWAAAITLGAGAAVAFGWPVITRPPLDPRSVSVMSFANRTADRTIEHLGRVVADRITQVLSATGVVEPVPIDNRDSRAPVIVSGEFHLESDRIVFQAWITDVRRNRIAWAVRPISSPIDSADRAIDEMGRRVAGAVAALRAPALASWFPTATLPPTLEAFQEFDDATELVARGFDSVAVVHLRRAVALDTTFVWARMQLAATSLALFEQSTADSIVGELNRNRDHLNPLQRQWLGWIQSVLTEDHMAAYRAITAAAELAPERFLVDVARSAMRLNRPHEAIAALQRLERAGAHNARSGAYWTLLTDCYHAVGDGEHELQAARAARRANIEPTRAVALEIRALVSLGRVEAVRAMLDTALALPLEQGPTRLQVMVGIARISSPPQLMIDAANELRAHGREDMAQEIFARALAWYRAQPAHAALNTKRQFEIAELLYLARDWAAADTAFRALAAADTNNYFYLGFLGKIAARRNDDGTARHIIAKFDSLRPSLPQPRAIAGYWQAKINALLGDQQRALTLLSETWPQGHYRLHADFDYESMWTRSEFRALIRPKG